MLGGLVCGPKPRTKRVQETWYKTVYSRNKPESAFFSMFRRANTQVVLRERTALVPSPHSECPFVWYDLFNLGMKKFISSVNPTSFGHFIPKYGMNFLHVFS